jgi:hypothetical protein
MKQVTMYKADDETLHEKAEDALKADAAFWKQRAQQLELRIPRETEDRHSGYEGRGACDHQ